MIPGDDHSEMVTACNFNIDYYEITFSADLTDLNQWRARRLPVAYINVMCAERLNSSIRGFDTAA